MNTLPEKIDRRTAARYEAVLGETATDLLARCVREDRHPTPDLLDRDAELMITSPDPRERRSARSVGEAIRWLARVAILVSRWTYDRVAL